MRTPSQGFNTYQKLLTNWYVAIHMAKSIVRTSNTLRESPLTGDFANFVSSSSSSVNLVSQARPARAERGSGEVPIVELGTGWV